MSGRHAFEALDHTLKDLTGNSHPMGGICMLFCGDFRQIHPVIPCNTRGNIVDEEIMDNVVAKHLQTNMRVYCVGTNQLDNLLTSC